jgi:hypothetical protein
VSTTHPPSRTTETVVVVEVDSVVTEEVEVVDEEVDEVASVTEEVAEVVDEVEVVVDSATEVVVDVVEVPPGGKSLLFPLSQSHADFTVVPGPEVSSHLPEPRSLSTNLFDYPISQCSLVIKSSQHSQYQKHPTQCHILPIFRSTSLLWLALYYEAFMYA